MANKLEQANYDILSVGECSQKHFETLKIEIKIKKEFEKCFSMHTLTVDFQESEDKHIYSLIEEIIKI